MQLIFPINFFCRWCIYNTLHNKQNIWNAFVCDDSYIFLCILHLWNQVHLENQVIYYICFWQLFWDKIIFVVNFIFCRWCIYNTLHNKQNIWNVLLCDDGNVLPLCILYIWKTSIGTRRKWSYFSHRAYVVDSYLEDKLFFW